MEEIEILCEELEGITLEDTREVVTVEKPVYPALEDITIKPTAEKQVFNHENSYGYDKVTVEAVETESLEVMPSAETQVNEGLYNKVTVAGDSDLVPENIKEGASIFGVEGSAKTTNAKITDASYLFTYNARIDYMYEILSLCENVINTNNMFASSRKITEVDLSNFDTSNVTTMNSMFYLCSKLTTLNLSNFNTSKVTDMGSMLQNCSKLTTLDLSSFDTSNVTNMSWMFGYCQVLNYLDIRNFTFDKVTTYYGMFDNMPKDCLIIVKGDTEKEWVLARRSDLTNVKTVAEL